MTLNHIRGNLICKYLLYILHRGDGHIFKNDISHSYLIRHLVDGKITRTIRKYRFSAVLSKYKKCNHLGPLRRGPSWVVLGPF